ncbi:S4 domain-containing protein YaaA [Pediococcus argentinicus]|uniref:S4 domain-containing protein YaaA n=1 Tax=Pediococcus argentinicus TaxID=480391 RepID=UPI00338FE498
MEKEIKITTPFITLGQMLKEEGIIGTGGQAKWYLRENTVLVNQEHDDRRGRKLYPDYVIEVPGEGGFIIKSKSGK